MSKLEDGLILHAAADEHDVERVAEFNGAIHRPEVVPMSIIASQRGKGEK
jgi:hypothetical protein